MRDWISIAALGSAGAAFLVILIAPAGGSASPQPSSSSEKVALRVTAESGALEEDRVALASLRSNIQALLEELQKPGQTSDVAAASRAAIERELEGRWGEFQKVLDSIKAAAKPPAN